MRAVLLDLLADQIDSGGWRANLAFWTCGAGLAVAATGVAVGVILAVRACTPVVRP